MTDASLFPELRVALVGCGYWGKNLARALAKTGALAFIADDDQDRAAEMASEHGCDAATLEAVLADPAIQAVVLATPAATHHDLASRALRSGKDVFVEKPMALTPDDGADLVSLAQSEGKLLMVGHLLQYHPVFQRLVDLVANGDLGRLQYLYSHRLNFGKIRREEDTLWSFAPHDLSMILRLAGEEPSKVRAEGSFVLHDSIADVTTTHLEFPSGLGAHVFVSWLNPNKEQKLVVVGDKAMAVFDDRQPWKEKLAIYDSTVEWTDGQPVAVGGDPIHLEVPESEPLLAEMVHFLDCVTTRTQPRTDGKEGLAVLKVLNKASTDLAAARPVPVAPPVSAIAPHPGVHSTAVVDDNVSIGDGTKVWHFSHILSNSSVGVGCSLGQNVVVGPNVSVGNGCKIQNNVSIYEGVTIEDDVFCGPSMVFTNVIHPRAFVSRKEEFAPTLVKRGASIGANATIVCGSTVGEYAFIAAGAVVTADVAPYALMVGVPARQIGWVSRSGEVLGDDLVCPRTGESYAVVGADLVPNLSTIPNGSTSNGVHV